MSDPHILVAGIGNIFLGDDAFGLEVVNRLARRTVPDYVRVADYGIRGLDLAYALLDDYDLVIMIDAAGRNEDPGTLFVIEPDQSDNAGGTEQILMDAHGMNPMRVLEMVRAMGGQLRRVLVVGCQPATFGDEFEGAMGLSAPVEAAVDGAIAIVESLISKFVAGQRLDRLLQSAEEEKVSHGTYTA